MCDVVDLVWSSFLEASKVVGANHIAVYPKLRYEYFYIQGSILQTRETICTCGKQVKLGAETTRNHLDTTFSHNNTHCIITCQEKSTHKGHCHLSISMSDLSLMHQLPETYFDAGLTNHPETNYCEENLLAQAVIRTLFPIPLSTLEDAFTVKMNVGSACLCEAVPQEEQLCLQEERENHHRRGALSAASNGCETNHHCSDISWDAFLPLVFDNFTSPSECYKPLTEDLAFCPSGNWNDNYSLSSDDDGVSLYGEQLSYCSSEDDNEGHFYFTPMPADFPQAFVPSTTLALAIYDLPKQELVHKEPEFAEQERNRELLYDEPEYAKQEFKRELEYEDHEHVEPERGDSTNVLTRSVRDGFEEAKTTPFSRGSSFSVPSTSRHGRNSSSMVFRSLQNKTKNVMNAPFTRGNSANMSNMAWRDGPKVICTAPLTRSGMRDNLDEFLTASKADASTHYKGCDSKDLLQKDGPVTLDHHTSGRVRQVVPRLVKRETKQVPTSMDGSEVSRRQVGHGGRSTRLKDPSRRVVTATPQQLPQENFCIGVSRNGCFVDV